MVLPPHCEKVLEIFRPMAELWACWPAPPQAVLGHCCHQGGLLRDLPGFIKIPGRLGDFVCVCAEFLRDPIQLY